MARHCPPAGRRRAAAALAPDYGIDEDRIWRHLRKSLRFRFYLQQAVERQRLLAGLQLAATAPGALVSRGQQAETLDGEALRLLSEAGGGNVPAEGGVGKQIERLGETAGLPPNMAWRARMAAERRGMDLKAAEARGFLDGLNSGLARNPVRPDSRPTGPESAPNRPDSASTGPESAPNRPDSASTGPETVSITPRLRSPQVSLRPPAEPPPQSSVMAIVDLDGPDLARLRAQGLLGRGAGAPDS